jgi:integrase/recombinase XerD
MGDQRLQTRDEWVEMFRVHMARTRGTCAERQRSLGRHIREFLGEVYGEASVDPREIAAPDVIGYVTSLVGRYSTSMLSSVGTALRHFFRFLRIHGVRDDRLEDVVPLAVKPRLGSLPRHIEAGDVERLIESLDRSTPRARRDRAMVLCVARLGLRAGEVARILFEDIDWRGARLHIRSRKTGRGAVLPIPVDVGEAIVEYLRDGRPATSCRQVFVLHHLRIGEPATPCTVYDAVKVALDKAEIDAPIRGPNLLRHTLATRLIRRGASLKEIADLFGHQCLEATQVYAKLDLSSLRTVAQPWPEVAS